jgi:enediyne biosynthesis protein E4
LLQIICGAICLSVSGHGAAAAEWSEGSGYRSLAVSPSGGRPGFTLIAEATTGISFTNRLEGDMFLTNAVAHNGSGVAIGDIDGDSLPEIYVCSLQGGNGLFRNKGNWRFERVQDLGPASCVEQMSTGAAFADVDGDGDLDLLVNGIAAGTRLFLNDGAGRFSESASSGLSRTNSATSMTLADIDGDGDLDLYCTHYIDVMHLADPTTAFALARRDGKWEVARVNGQSTRAPKWKDRFEALPDGSVREWPEVHALYRNDGKGHFTAIQNEAGTYQDENGKAIPPFRDWGLAAMFRDINGDGAPDLYVCNDNASPDRFWINNENGTFRAAEKFALRHTSRSSMGLDFADVDRDGRDDFIVVDMFARTHAKRMTQLVKDRPDPAARERAEEQPRFNRNTLFLGRADGSFAEAAFMAGVAASDWSWCPIFLDVDLDGYEDLLVSNGFSFDVMDQDSADYVKQTRLSSEQLKRARQLRPRWATVLAAFRNKRDGTFAPAAAEWGFSEPAICYGMALGDLDGDGDLDLVVNRLNQPPALYRNDSPAARIAVRLKGEGPNREGIGARIRLIGAKLTQEQEMISGGRYMSSDQPMRVFAAIENGPTRLEVRWRDGRESLVTNIQANRIYEIDQKGSAPVQREKPATGEAFFADVSELLNHLHVETAFDDWARQPLLPRRLSREGPAAIWSDLNQDGWEDLTLISGTNGDRSIYLSQQGKTFRKSETATNALADAAIGARAVADIDGDGDLDSFARGRAIPGKYPETTDSLIFLNEQGELKSSAAMSTALKAIGFVTGAVFADLDGDNDPDLAVSTEWGPIRIFQNDSGKFSDITERAGLADKKGLWTSIVAGDFDGDGRLDLAAGNWGLNTPYAIYGPEPLRLYYGDWDQNGSVEIIEAWRSNGKWLPIRDKTWLSRGLPDLQQQFKTHAAFTSASIEEILGPGLNQARILEASEFRSCVFLNRGSRFEAVPLPREAQLSPVMAVAVGDLDGDGNEDLFASQNFFGTGSDLSREDSGEGLWLRGLGNGRFSAVAASVSGIKAHGEQRGIALADFNDDNRVDIVLAQNNGPTKLYENKRAKPGLKVILKGPKTNPAGVGALVKVVYADGSSGPSRLVSSGSPQVLGLREPAQKVSIRSPGGKEQLFLVNNGDPIEAEYAP